MAKKDFAVTESRLVEIEDPFRRRCPRQELEAPARETQPQGVTCRRIEERLAWLAPVTA